MRFVTFSQGATTRAGVVIANPATRESEVIDLGHPFYAGCLAGMPPDLLAMVEQGLSSIAQRIGTLNGGPDESRLKLSDVTLLAPIMRPPRIVGAAHNYRCALMERGMEPPSAPVFFEKHPETVVGPGAPVILPHGAGGVTYEAELAVVIDRHADKVSEANAMSYVAGYTLFNDVSASEVIKSDGAFDRGKNFPTFGPMGPWLATPDELDPIAGARVTMEVDGMLRQDGTTADLLFGVAQMISRLSHQRPLAPGTVIATGTPAGVAPVQNPPTWLVSGTEMTVEIEGLGRLTNPIQNEEAGNGL